MELEAAKEIVTSLANGIDPITGEVFSDDSPYNHPNIVRALYTVLNHVSTPKRSKLSIEEKQAQNMAAGRPKNAGLAWTEDLKKEVAQLFSSGKSIPQLARHFERTDGAILSELVRQEVIHEDEKQKYR